jgi:hypothetical protein
MSMRQSSWLCATSGLFYVVKVVVRVVTKAMVTAAVVVLAPKYGWKKASRPTDLHANKCARAHEHKDHDVHAVHAVYTFYAVVGVQGVCTHHWDVVYQAHG